MTTDPRNARSGRSAPSDPFALSNPAAPSDPSAPSDPTAPDAARRRYAADSLAGLSVGDALGAQYWVPGRRVADLLAGVLPPPIWEWTDDTEMACSIIWLLAERGHIDQDLLAWSFADRSEFNRGYGAGAFTILHQIREGIPWQAAAAAAFGGAGSMGNGAAMRVAPLGAYFAGDVHRAADQARASAEVTHAHPDGVAGAVAVAVATCVAAVTRQRGDIHQAGPFMDQVIEATPAGRVREGLARARRMLHLSAAQVAYELGNGASVTAGDTVPFTVWVAARYLADYPGAVRTCIAAGGDIDTTSAIAGGIVSAHTGTAGIPDAWLASREPLPDWVPARSAWHQTEPSPDSL